MPPLLLPLHLTLLVAGAIATLVGGALAWPYRRTSAGTALLLLLLAVAEWQVASALGVSSLTIEGKRFWSQVEYVGVVAVAPLWLAFVLRYLGNPLGRNARWLAASAVFPALTLAAAATSAHHHLLWTRIELTSTPDGMAAVFRHGPLFWVAAVYNYALLAAGAWLLVRARPAPATVAMQRRLLLFANIVPWLANVLYLVAPNVVPGMDPTPIAFGVSGVCAAIAIADLGILELSPARLWHRRQD